MLSSSCGPRASLLSMLASEHHLSAAQFLTVNSGRRFFFLNRTPSVLLSSASERPSTAKTTQHPDSSIDPQVDPSHPSPHPSLVFQRPRVPIQILIHKWTKLTRSLPPPSPAPPPPPPSLVSPMILTRESVSTFWFDTEKALFEVILGLL